MSRLISNLDGGRSSGRQFTDTTSQNCVVSEKIDYDYWRLIKIENNVFFWDSSLKFLLTDSIFG